MSAATDGMEEIVNEFLAESAEGLDRLERDLVALEHDPALPCYRSKSSVRYTPSRAAAACWAIPS
jgi:hypothetical protein